MKMKAVRLLLGVLFLFAASASVLADDTYVYTFTSKTWNSTATLNNESTTPTQWNYSKQGYSYSTDYGVRCRRNEAAEFIICAPVSLEHIKSITVYYQQAASSTGNFYFSVSPESSYTYNTANQFASQAVSSSNEQTKNFTKSGLDVSGFLQIKIVPTSSYTTRATAISKVTIVVAPPADPYTVSFNAHGVTENPASLTEASGGAGVILPSVSDLDCGSWEHIGWRETHLSTATTTEPSGIFAVGSRYYPQSNRTLHAVFRLAGELVEASKTIRYTLPTSYQSSTSISTTTTPAGEANVWTSSSAPGDGDSHGLGWGYSAQPTLTSPISYSNVTKVSFKPYTSSGTVTYTVSVGGTQVGAPSTQSTQQDVSVSDKSGKVTIKLGQNTSGRRTKFIQWIEVTFLSSQQSYTYSGVPICPVDISERLLWSANGFTLEGASSGSLTSPSSVAGVRDANKDILTFNTSLVAGSKLYFNADGVSYKAIVPTIISASTSTVNSTATSDIVILPGSKLTLSSGTINVRDIIIYRNNDHSGQLDFRGGTLNVNGSVKLALTIDPKRFYFFGTPYASALNRAQYLNGAPTNYNTSSATTDWWIVQNYDGARRATVGLDEDNWQGIQSASTQLKAAEGHAIGIDIVGKPNAQRTYVFPINANLSTENNAKTVTLTTHPTSLSQLDEGWNLICNPYLHTMSGQGARLPTNRLLYFVRPYKGTDQRFQQYLASEINDIEPFEVFFVQVRGSSNSTLTLGGNGARPSAPRRAGDLNEEEVFFLRLNLFTPDSDNDNATMVVGSEFSASELVAGEDMEKFGGGNFVSLYLIEQGSKLAFDAINFNDAASGTRLGFKTVAAGEHRISFSEINGNEQGIEHVWIKDEVENKNVDLLSDDYVFTTGKGTFEDRFVVRAEFKNHQGEITAIDATSPDVTIYVVDDVIHADGITNQDIMLFGADGKMLYSGSARVSWSSASLQQGMYVLKVGAKTYKVVL